MHRLAERRVGELCGRRGADWWRSACAEVWDYAERRTRAAIAEMPDGRYEATETVEAAEGDLEIRAAVEIDGDAVRVDFAGTAPQHGGNLNCPLAVTVSACCFVLRVVADPDAPASGGAYAPIAVAAPEGSLVNAQPPAAVVAGNVETSSRIADCLLRAFGKAVDAPAQGQGTMNNLTFGSARFTYYETIGGGQGGSAAGPGPSAVHVAMSNTLNTPVEALEAAYPLRVERYALRAGSGGAGRHPGGDGVIRAITVLEPCEASILSDRRRHPPRGAAGGEPGAPGTNRLNGRPLGPKARVTPRSRATRSRSGRRAAAATVRRDADRRRRRREHRRGRRRGRAAARPRPRAAPARRARRGRARRLGVGVRGRRPRRRRRPRRPGRRVLLDRHRRVDRRQQGRRAYARRCAATPRRPRARASWNDANVLALSLRTTSEAVLAEILDAWFAAGPSLDDEATTRANVAHLTRSTRSPGARPRDPARVRAGA